MKKLKKVLTFIGIYGVHRTLYKVLGRTRNIPKIFRYANKEKAGNPVIGFVGCGQFAFATMSFFLRQHRVYFRFAYDPDPSALESFCSFNNIAGKLTSNKSLPLQSIDILYIASNHFSHTGYAVEALQKGRKVYIEKPVSVNWEQFYSLGRAINTAPENVYFGYNRPYSAAIDEVRPLIADSRSPISMSCFIVGHFLPPDHWYREPQEGTRICGNMGHWLDLALHLLKHRGLPEYLDVTVVYSSQEQNDDDLAVTLTSSRGDLITISLTSRSEPFEGICESIQIHAEDLMVSIEDFRRATFWVGDSRYSRNYKKKDVGHGKAILRPFYGASDRTSEVRLSTALMLEVTDLVRARRQSVRFELGNQKYNWNLDETNTAELS